MSPWPWNRLRRVRRGIDAAEKAYRDSLGELNATVQLWPEVRREAERHRLIFAENHFAEAVTAEFARRRTA